MGGRHTLADRDNEIGKCGRRPFVCPLALDDSSALGVQYVID